MFADRRSLYRAALAAALGTGAALAAPAAQATVVTSGLVSPGNLATNPNATGQILVGFGASPVRWRSTPAPPATASPR